MKIGQAVYRQQQLEHACGDDAGVEGADEKKDEETVDADYEKKDDKGEMVQIW